MAAFLVDVLTANDHKEGMAAFPDEVTGLAVDRMERRSYRRQV